MRIFNGFLIIFCAVCLFFLVPFTAGTYAFKTDLREDNFTVATGIGVTTATVQLFKAVYDDDTNTISITSDNASEAPLYSSYNATSRALAMSGLSANGTRTISVTYDVDALPGIAVLATLLDYSPFWLYLICIMYLGAAIAMVIIEVIKRWRG